jgi:phosphatidylserine/phosphatidylglycerophosphate/cardiolipin synthase-like enzyme
LVQQDSNGVFFYSIPLHFSAPSAEKSIEVLFNRSIDHAFSDGSTPLAIGSSAIETDLIARIDNVTSTLDIAMYNTGRSSIVQAINRAVQRGVSVRYIADDENSNTALEGTLSFPVLYRSGSGIMHNKFVIADADDEDRAWLWTGSTNLTTNQLAVDPNHAYIIHDQAMTRNYLREFDEMWGDFSGNPRSGDFKTNNTAHLFQAGNALIESWFSPSDETNCHLIEALRSTDHQVLIGLLLLTMEELVDEIIALHQDGKEVRVIIDDEESSSEALMRLTQADVNAVIHDPSTIFHHKYAIIDEGYPDSDPQVVTGSHNWTWSADNINDENTLIIHDQSFTNIFRQEFEARWEELNPSATKEAAANSLEAFPNPASDVIHLHNSTSNTCNVVFYDVHGHSLFSEIVHEDQTNVVQLDKSISPGIYMLRFTWPDHSFTTQAINVQ